MKYQLSSQESSEWQDAIKKYNRSMIIPRLLLIGTMFISAALIKYTYLLDVSKTPKQQRIQAQMENNESKRIFFRTQLAVDSFKVGQDRIPANVSRHKELMQYYSPVSKEQIAELKQGYQDCVAESLQLVSKPEYAEATNIDDHNSINHKIGWTGSALLSIIGLGRYYFTRNKKSKHLEELEKHYDRPRQVLQFLDVTPKITNSDTLSTLTGMIKKMEYIDAVYQGENEIVTITRTHDVTEGALVKQKIQDLENITADAKTSFVSRINLLKVIREP